MCFQFNWQVGVISVYRSEDTLIKVRSNVARQFRLVSYMKAPTVLLLPDRRAEYCYDHVCLSVCLFVCLSVREHTSNYKSDVHQSSRVLPVAVARSSSGSVAICYVLPVL